MTSRQRAFQVKIVGDVADAKRSLQSMEQSIGKFDRAIGMAGKAFGAFMVAQPMLQFAGDAIELASAAEEVDSKFQAVYGTADELRSQLEAWGDMAGVTETKAMDLAATFGNLAMAQGVSRDVTEELVGKVAGLAGDLASFNDADPQMVFEDLNKALLTTEREGMKKYGIAISETEVKQRALALAVADGRTEATKADRAMASYQIAVQQAGKALGDLERTQDSTANRMRQARATIEEMQTEIGEALLPAVADTVEAFNDLAPAIAWAAKVAAQSLGNLGNLTGAISDAGDSSKTAAERFGDFAAGTTRWATYIPIVGSVAEGFAQRLDRIGESGRRSGGGVRNLDDAIADLETTIVTSATYIDPTIAGWEQQWKDLRTEMGLPLKIANPDTAELNRLSRMIITARLEFLGLRDALAGGGGAKPSSTVNIPMMAEGGIVTKPTLAMIGEAGPEAVIPLRPGAGGGVGTTTINIHVDAYPGVDMAEAGRRIVDALVAHERFAGSEWRTRTAVG